MAELGQFLVALRAKKGLTQQQFGELCGVDARTICAWENDEKSPSLGSLRKLHKIAEQEKLGEEFAAIVFHKESRLAA